MRTEEENREIAQLLFPEVGESVEDIFKRYPKRKLKDSQLVVRFAPSPTGFLHVGSVYTSLINRKLADQTDGICILRIEDTDKKREIEGGIDLIINGLERFGIKFDESVKKGEYGPYIQSERKEIYKVFAKDMIARGCAYPCFASEKELEEIRKKQSESGVRTGYYGKWALWRDAKVEDVKRALNEGKRFVVRLYSTGNFNNKFTFNDLIKGNCTFSENDMDIVLLKSDGLPTYHFAHPIDDTLMGINLVIRTYEWFPSVPLHLEIFDKLGFKRINYAHPAPLMKMDKGNKRKLSKRKDPEADASFFLHQGYPQVGMLEYFLSIMNSNFEDWRIQNPSLPYTDFELKLEKFNKAGALFDMVKLSDVCKEYISRLSAEQVYNFVLEWAKEFDMDIYNRMINNKGYCISIFNIEREGDKKRKDMSKWSDVKEQFKIFFDDMFNDMKKDVLDMDRGLQINILKEFLATYYYGDSSTEWFDKIKRIAQDNGFAIDYKEYEKEPSKYKGKVGDVAGVIRVAVTGRKQSPDLYQVMQVM
ncbi:MAG TPA: glutamate--tRNA ligase family protein, partial [Candidatus Dojkabacteria bacterium]|nr:glutamate--tRNA ligase family protein [Candidatus Dojkabacteria bacterium]